MARKTKEDAEATREGILNAAELCFLEEGVFRTTLEHIAARAGYTRGAVYWHFRNKLEVLEAVIARIEVPLFCGLERVVARSGSAAPLRALREFYVSAFDEFARNPHARNALEISMLRCELVGETKPVFLRMQRNATRALARVTEIFVEAQRLGHLRPGLEPAVCARALHFLVLGAVREWLRSPGTVSLQRDGLAAVDAVLGGFAASGALQDDAAAGRPAHHA